MAQPTHAVCWFEIPCADLTRAQAFYEKTFDVKLQWNEMGPCKMATFPSREDAAGSSGSLVTGPGYVPSSEGALIYFTTPDLDRSLNRALAAGGKVLQARTSIGQYGAIAVFEDSEGNRVGLHQAP